MPGLRFEVILGFITAIIFARILSGSFHGSCFSIIGLYPDSNKSAYLFLFCPAYTRP
jgi:hypothetical protein